MTRSAVNILGGLAIAWMLVELAFPPVSHTYWSPDWGGAWRTVHARRVLVYGSHWEVNYGVLVLEGALVAVAVVAGLTGLRRKAQANGTHPDGIPSRVIARCALGLHTSVVFLPLCSAGGDTISLLTPVAFIIIGVVFLWPNLVAFLIARKLSGLLNDASDSSFSGSWVMPFLVIVALIWSLLLVVGAAGILDVKPLGGAIWGTAALWLTAWAQARQRVIATPSGGIPSSTQQKARRR